LKIEGHLRGLSAAQKQQIERLFRRRVPPRQIVSHELAREITGMSRQLNRRIGLLIDRSGRIEAVSVGEVHTLGVPRKPSAP
jgi:GTP-binding protein HflX